MSIKHWPQTERPREKLLKKGADHLSNAELLAIFLRTGIKGKSAMDLARDMLNHFGNLRALFNADAKTFLNIKGLGIAKFAGIQAVMEMSRRYFFEEASNKTVLENSEVTKRYILSKLADRKQEVFACLFLDKKHQVIAFSELFYGTIDRADIYPREVVKTALYHNASSVIFAHNHPSGDPEPSTTDIQLTKNLEKTLALIEVQVLDHIIVGASSVSSLLELGYLS